MNETNRTAIVLLAAAWIVLMAVVIFIAWSDSQLAVDRLTDMVEYLDDNQDNAAKLILTLGALVLIVLSLLLIIVELAPPEETKEIKVEQAGATTIVPAEPLRLRLEEALSALAKVSEAKARVYSQDKGVGMELNLTVTPDANVAVVSQEASRTVVETLQADLGLPVAAPPVVRVNFGDGGAKEPAVSSVAQPPQPGQAPGAPPAPPPPAEGPQPGAQQPSRPLEGEQPGEGTQRESATPEDMWPSEPPSQPEDRPEDETQQPL